MAERGIMGNTGRPDPPGRRLVSGGSRGTASWDGAHFILYHGDQAPVLV